MTDATNEKVMKKILPYIRKSRRKKTNGKSLRRNERKAEAL